MFKIQTGIYALQVLITYFQISNGESNVRRPEDLFPNDPIYVMPNQSNLKVKNPFSDTYNREDPDGLFLGFFPIWSVLLVALAFIFGIIGICGFIGYLLGCRNPNKKLKIKNPKTKIYLNDDDTALKMIDTAERDYENSFKKAKLTNFT